MRESLNQVVLRVEVKIRIIIDMLRDGSFVHGGGEI